MPAQRKLVLSPRNGTRFKIYAQSPALKAFREPELVTVSLPPSRIQPGPADERIVVRRQRKISGYPCEFPQAFVPGDGREWLGAVDPAVQPGPDGHFDRLTQDSDEFAAAAVYAIARRVSDIWEWYFGRRIDWHFLDGHGGPLADRCLEIVPALSSDVAHAGFGFVEYGASDTSDQFNHVGPYWKNFDVIAHELGHQFIYAVVGFPANTRKDAPWTNIGTAEFRAFHESAGDLIALLSSLHFDSVRAHLLASTSGNLGTFNEVSRIGELSKSFQFRSAFNYSKVKLDADGSIKRLYLADPEQTTDDGLPGSVTSLAPPAANADPVARRVFYYRASQVLTGAVFDMLVETFQAILVAKRLIPAELAQEAEATWDIDPDAGPAARRELVRRLERVHARFVRAYRGNGAAFDKALGTARDYMGRLLAAHWSALSASNMTFLKIARGLKTAARQAPRDGLPAGTAAEEIVTRCLSWRGIEV